MIGDVDVEIRRRVFEWLADRRQAGSDVLSRRELEAFAIGDRRIPLVGPSGIWKPAACEPPSLDYHDHPRPIFRLVRRGRRYPPIFIPRIGPGASRQRRPAPCLAPTSAVGLLPCAGAGLVCRGVPRFRGRRRSLAADVHDAGGRSRGSVHRGSVPEPAGGRASCVCDPNRSTATPSDGLSRAGHSGLPGSMLCAHYGTWHCWMLRTSLLHSDAEGEPVVSNGVALCKLHHAAFDGLFFAIRPDYRIEVRPSILAESDGPMLVVGLQQIHDKQILLPRRDDQRPDPQRLDRRYRHSSGRRSPYRSMTRIAQSQSNSTRR